MSPTKPDVFVLGLGAFSRKHDLGAFAWTTNVENERVSVMDARMVVNHPS
jgi:hypothetical protein